MIGLQSFFIILLSVILISSALVTFIPFVFADNNKTTEKISIILSLKTSDDAKNELKTEVKELSVQLIAELDEFDIIIFLLSTID